MAQRNSQLKVEVVGDTSKLDRAMEGTRKRMSGLGGAVSRFGKFAGKGVGVAGAAAVAAAGKLATFGDEVAEAASQAGLGTEQYQELKFAFDELGVSTPDKALQKFSRRIGEAADGSGAAVSSVETLGLELENTDGSMRDTGEVMDDAIDKLAGVESESRRAAIAGNLFGKRAGPELASALGDGAEGIEDARQKAHDMGLVMGEDALEASQKFAGVMDDVKNRALGLLRQGLTPVLEFISDNVIPFIEDRVVPALAMFSEWVGPKLSAAAEVAQQFFDTKLVPAFEALSAWWEENGPSIISTARSIGETIVNFARTSRENVMAFAGAVDGAISTVVGWFRTSGGQASETSTRMQAVFSQLLSTTRTVWNAISTVVRTTIEAVSAVVRATVAVIQAVWKRWGSDIKQFARTVWNAILTIIEGVLQTISGVFDVFAGLFTGDWERVWDGIKSIFAGILSIIQGLWETALAQVELALTVFRDTLREVWSALWAWVKDFVSDRVDDVVGFVRDLPGRALSALDNTWGAYQEFWREKWQAAANWASDRFDDLVGWVGDLPGRARTALSDAWETYQAFWREKWRQAAGFVSDRFGDMVQDHREFPGEAKGALAEVWGTLRSFWDDEMRGIRDFAGARVDDVVGFIRGLPGRAREAMASTWTDFHAWWNDQFITIKDWVSNRVDDVVDFFRNLPGRISSVLSNLGSTIKDAFSFDLSIGGEAGGPGDGRMPPGGSVIDRLNAYMDSTGIAHRTTSTFRPGDSGFHGMGRAVDFAGRVPGRNTPNLMSIQRAWVPLAASGQLRELIGPDPTMNFKNGRQGPGVYPPDVQEAHENHVHTAMRAGGMIAEPIFGIGASGRTYSFGEEGPETVRPGRGGGSDGAAIGEVVDELRALRRDVNRGGGGDITVVVELDGRRVSEQVAERMVHDIRLKTGRRD